MKLLLTLLHFVALCSFSVSVYSMKRKAPLLERNNKKKRKIREVTGQLQDDINTESLALDQYDLLIHPLDLSKELSQADMCKLKKELFKKCLFKRYDSYLLSFINVPKKAGSHVNVECSSQNKPVKLFLPSPVAFTQKKNGDRENRMLKKIKFSVVKNQYVALSYAKAVKIHNLSSGKELITCEKFVDSKSKKILDSTTSFMYDTSLEETLYSDIYYELMSEKNALSIMYPNMSSSSRIVDKNAQEIKSFVVIPGGKADTVVTLSSAGVIKKWNLPHLRYLNGKQLALLVLWEKAKKLGKKVVLHDTWQKVFDSLDESIQKKLQYVASENTNYCNIM